MKRKVSPYRYQQAITFLFLITAALSGTAAKKRDEPNCRITVSKVGKTEAKRVPARIGRYQSVVESERPIELNFKGEWAFRPKNVEHWVARTRLYEGDVFLTEVFSVESRPGWPQSSNSKAIKEPYNNSKIEKQRWNLLKADVEQNWKTVKQTVIEAVEFAREQDKLRRGWPDSFLSHLDSMALDNLHNSTYVITRDKATQQIVSTLRIYRSDHERRLPAQPGPLDPKMKFFRSGNSPDYYFEPSLTDARPFQSYNPPNPLILEKYLGVEVERPVVDLHLKDMKTMRLGVGAVFEPGLWAVNPKYSELGITESLIHLLNSIIESRDNISADYNARAKTLYTYGDEVGVRLYSQLGFQPVGSKIEKDGISWQVLRLDSASALNLMNRLEELRRNISSERAIETRDTLIRLFENQRSLSAPSISPK